MTDGGYGRWPSFPQGCRKPRQRAKMKEPSPVFSPALIQYEDAYNILRRKNLIEDIERNIESFCGDKVSTGPFKLVETFTAPGYQCKPKRHVKNNLILWLKLKKWLPDRIKNSDQTEVEAVQSEHFGMFKCSDVLVSLYRHELTERFTENFSEKVPADLLEPDKQSDQLFNNFITGTIEGLLTNKAHRHALANEFNNILIARDSGRFTEEFCMELIDRLDLDPYDPRKILFHIYQDLMKSIEGSESLRGWGKLVKKSSGTLFINVHCDEYLQEHFSEIDDSWWQPS